MTILNIYLHVIANQEKYPEESTHSLNVQASLAARYAVEKKNVRVWDPEKHLKELQDFVSSTSQTETQKSLHVVIATGNETLGFESLFNMASDPKLKQAVFTIFFSQTLFNELVHKGLDCFDIVGLPYRERKRLKVIFSRNANAKAMLNPIVTTYQVSEKISKTTKIKEINLTQVQSVEQAVDITCYQIQPILNERCMLMRLGFIEKPSSNTLLRVLRLYKGNPNEKLGYFANILVNRAIWLNDQYVADWLFISPLHQAAARGDMQALDEIAKKWRIAKLEAENSAYSDRPLLVHPEQNNTPDDFGKTPLCYALLYNQSQAADFIVEKLGVDIHAVIPKSDGLTLEAFTEIAKDDVLKAAWDALKERQSSKMSPVPVQENLNVERKSAAETNHPLLFSRQLTRKSSDSHIKENSPKKQQSSFEKPLSRLEKRRAYQKKKKIAQQEKRREILREIRNNSRVNC